jgi:hypothetical protein
MIVLCGREGYFSPGGGATTSIRPVPSAPAAKCRSARVSRADGKARAV